MKTYIVTYIEKYRCRSYEESMEVQAANAKEACQKCVELNYEHTGRHAFHTKAKVKK